MIKIQSPFEVIYYDHHNQYKEVLMRYSHKESLGLIKCSYMWKDHVTNAIGKVDIWVDKLETLQRLCQLWTNNKWRYMPLTFA